MDLKQEILLNMKLARDGDEGGFDRAYELIKYELEPKLDEWGEALRTNDSFNASDFTHYDLDSLMTFLWVYEIKVDEHPEIILEKIREYNRQPDPASYFSELIEQNLVPERGWKNELMPEILGDCIRSLSF